MTTGTIAIMIVIFAVGVGAGLWLGYVMAYIGMIEK